MQWRRPIWIFVSLVAVGLALVGCLNILFGGGRDLLRGDTGMAEIVGEQVTTGRILLTPPDFNDRYFKRELLRQRASEIRMVVTGSSRVFLLDADMFQTVLGADTREFVNAGMQGSTLEDHIIIWQICKELGITPKVFFIGIDPWILNENSGESRWEALDREFRSFKYPLTNGSRSLMFYLTDRSVRYEWLRITDLLGAPRLLIAFQGIRRMMRGEGLRTLSEKELLLVENSARPPERAGNRVDGSMIYPKSQAEARFTGEDAKRILGQARAGKFYHFENWHQLGTERMHLLQSLLRDMWDQGVQVIGFTVPYVPEYYDVLRANKNYMRLLRQQRRFLSENFAALGFEYFDLLDPGIAGLDSEEFVDYIHPTRDGMAKLLNYIRDHSAGLKRNLTLAQ